MSNQNKIILGFIAFILTTHFVIIPFFHRRQALRTAETVLALWKSEDLAASFQYWVKEELSPPVYGVTSYTITDEKFFMENGRRAARVFTKIDFSAGNFLKGGLWVFELRHTKKGWKIIDFKRINN